MFKEFFIFEIKSWSTRPTIYLFFLINFALVLSASILDVTVGAKMGNVNINAPFALMSYASFVSLISVVMTTTFVNQAALKDFTNNFHSILFATPIKRSSYLLGRITSSIVLACIPLLGVLLAIYVAPYFYDDISKVGPTYGMAYVDTFFTFLLPNTILISAIIFALSVKFRSTTISFIGAIILIVGYLLASSYADNIDKEYVAILADPFGMNSIAAITKYWTLSEKNSQWLNFTGPMLANRLLWLSISLVIFSISYYTFSFSTKKTKQSKKREVKKSSITSPLLTSQFKVLPQLPSTTQYFNFKSQWTQLRLQCSSEFFGIIKSPAFLILVLLTAFNMIANLNGSDYRYASGNLPVTYIILEGIENSLHLFIYVIIAYYTGVMVWRERRAKFNEIIDASPFPTWIPIASKYISILGVVFVILLLAMGIGMSIQAIKGYYQFEPLLYCKQLFLIDMSKFAIMISVSLFIHVCVNQMYLGYFLYILFLVLNHFVWGALEMDSNLLSIGSVPSFIYSDMHQYSLAVSGLIWYNLYWFLFAALLIIGSTLFWVRGLSLNRQSRWAITKQRFDKPVSFSFYSICGIWIIIGGFLFYNANVMNKPLSASEEIQIDLTYEQLYKKYEDNHQPRIVALDHVIDIFPNTRKVFVATQVTIKNKHDHAIDSIHFTKVYDYETRIDLPKSALVSSDEKHQFFTYELAHPLMPADSLTFMVYSSYEAKGIENELEMKWINENGTFVHNYAFMPTIGYDAGREYEGAAARKKKGLTAIQRMPVLHESCSAACGNSYISTDSDWIRLSSTISTSADQVAIAPGTLKKEWSEEGRNYYRYELDQPVLNFYSFLSGRYEVQREKWGDVDLEVYYHPSHAYNVDKMMHSMRLSLDYYSKNFSPYPHTQARIIEFPRFAAFAQAFPGTMPYSESMGFIGDLKDEEDLDQVFFTIAHEMAHQWWAHQVIGADVQGATMLSESFAHYSAMMVLEKEYGPEMSKKFLKYEMDTYLRSRGGEQIAELPLMKVENQDYIQYSKGSVVMNALKAYIGEDSLNHVMQRFIKQTAYQEPPYTNTNIFMGELEKVIPDSFQYLMNDMFKDIILYNNKTVSGTYKRLENGRYEVTLDLEIEKYRADKKGMEAYIDVNDYLYVGIYAEPNRGERQGKELYYALHKFNSKNSTVTITIDDVPYRAGIDPNQLMIDRVHNDNVVKLNLL